MAAFRVAISCGPNAVGDGGTLGAFVLALPALFQWQQRGRTCPLLPPLPQIEDHCVAADFRGLVSAVGRGECVAATCPDGWAISATDG